MKVWLYYSMAADGVVTTVRSTPPRTNGWGCPWHPLQVVAWIYIFVMAVSHYGFLVYYFPSYWRLLGYIFPGIILITIITSLCVTTSIDPCDPRLKQNIAIGLFRRGHFDRSQHQHVIEDLHCHLCNTDVTYKAKHCKICDKCIEGFDHHCKWMNTCIGTKNYRWFITTLTSGLIGATTATIIPIIFFILFFATRDNVRHYCDTVYNISESCDSTVKLFGLQVNEYVFPALTGVFTLLNGTALVLVGHLTMFHYYLIYKGMSTYDYITSHRESNNTGSDANTRTCCGTRANRISPLAVEEDDDDDNDGERDRDSVESASRATFNRTPPLLTEDTEGGPTEDTGGVGLHDDLELRYLSNTDLMDDGRDKLLESTNPVINDSLITTNDLLITTNDVILPVEHSPSPLPPATPPLIEDTGLPLHTATPPLIEDTGLPLHTATPPLIEDTGLPLHTAIPPLIEDTGLPLHTATPPLIEDTGLPLHTPPLIEDTPAELLYHKLHHHVV